MLHLLPLAKRSYIFDHLTYILADRKCPGDEWIRGMLSRNTHSAYLYAYGLARRVPYATIPKQSHVRAHLGYALTTMRRALQEGQYTESLAELNVMLAAHAFFSDRIDEWLAHTLACKDIIVRMGGLSNLDPIIRAVIFVSGPVACGRVLLHPTFSSADFNIDVPALKDDPKLRIYTPELDPSSIPIANTDLRGLFEMHQEYHQLYHEYRNHVINLPIHPWLDRRFHQLNIISLEVYFKVYKMNPVTVSEDQRIRVQINGILTLALTYLHQYIYHYTRQIGDKDITSLWSPFLTIFYEHLRNHLKRLFEFETYEVMNDYAPILWAVFVLMCNERLRAKRNKLLRLEPQAEDDWAAPVFQRIVQKLPPESRNVHEIRSLF